MHTLTKKFLVLNAHANWKRQYFHPKKGWREIWHDDSEAIYKKLLVATSEGEVTKAIGNDGWTKNVCDECKQDREVTIVVADDDDSECSPSRLCKPCLVAALAMIDLESVDPEGRDPQHES